MIDRAEVFYSISSLVQANTLSTIKKALSSPKSPTKLTLDESRELATGSLLFALNTVTKYREEVGSSTKEHTNLTDMVGKITTLITGIDSPDLTLLTKLQELIDITNKWLDEDALTSANQVAAEKLCLSLYAVIKKTELGLGGLGFIASLFISREIKQLAALLAKIEKQAIALNSNIAAVARAVVQPAPAPLAPEPVAVAVTTEIAEANPPSAHPAAEPIAEPISTERTEPEVPLKNKITLIMVELDGQKDALEKFILEEQEQEKEKAVGKLIKAEHPELGEELVHANTIANTMMNIGSKVQDIFTFIKDNESYKSLISHTSSKDKDEWTRLLGSTLLRAPHSTRPGIPEVVSDAEMTKVKTLKAALKRLVLNHMRDIERELGSLHETKLQKIKTPESPAIAALKVLLAENRKNHAAFAGHLSFLIKVQKNQEKLEKIVNVEAKLKGFVKQHDSWVKRVINTLTFGLLNSEYVNAVKEATQLKQVKQTEIAQLKQEYALYIKNGIREIDKDITIPEKVKKAVDQLKVGDVTISQSDEQSSKNIREELENIKKEASPPEGPQGSLS